MFSAINRKIKRIVLRQQKKRPVVMISDTTCRDGAQMPGLRLSVDDKVRIAKALSEAGVHSIDCGFPAAGPHEIAAIKAIAASVKGPVLSCLARTKAEDVEMAADALRAVSPFKKAISLFIGTSPLHREHKHQMTKAQVLKTAVAAIEKAGAHFEMISFGAEDASRTEPDFLSEVYEAAIQAGALSIGFADTVGILTPRKAADAVKRIQDTVPSADDAMLGVHFHNDLGLATANSLACVSAGANMVQGTVNGIGERAGNVAIEEVILALVLHEDEYKKKMSVDPGALYRLSRLVAELTGLEPPVNKPVVGRNLFRTEAGIHQDGILQCPETYTPFPPQLIGAGPIELVLSHHSGRAAVRHHLQASGVEATEEHVQLVLDYIKNENHDPSDHPEIQGFLDRIKPFMAEDEYKSRKNGAAAPAP